MQRKIWSAVLAAAFGWGTGGVITRMALDDGASPYEIAMVRGALAAIGVIVFLSLRRGLTRPTRIEWKVGVVMAVTNMAIPFVLGTVALQYASAGFVALPLALVPLTTAALAHLFLPDERLTTAKVLGLVTALAGVAVLLLSGDSGLEVGGRPLVAGLLGLISVMAIAVGSVFAKRHAGSYSALSVSAIQFTIGAVAVTLVSFGVEGGAGIGPTAAWPELLYLAAITTFLPFTIFYWLIRHVTVTYASVIGYIVPLIAVIAGVLVLDEQIQSGILLGGILILAGVVLTDRLEHRVRPAAGSGGR